MALTVEKLFQSYDYDENTIHQIAGEQIQKPHNKKPIIRKSPDYIVKEFNISHWDIMIQEINTISKIDKNNNKKLLFSNLASEKKPKELSGNNIIWGRLADCFPVLMAIVISDQEELEDPNTFVIGKRNDHQIDMIPVTIFNAEKNLDSFKKEVIKYYTDKYNLR